MITLINNTISNSSLDFHARQFINATKLTDTIQIRAINELCKDLKRDGFWDKIQLIYPFVYNTGFTSSIFYELKNCTNNFSIGNTSSGTASTFSNTGVKFNGGQTLESSVITSIQNGLSVPPGHFAVYMRSNSPSKTELNGSYTLSTPPSNSPTLCFGFSEYNSILFSWFKGNEELISSGFNTESINDYYYSNSKGLWIFSADSKGNGLSASTFNPITYRLSQNGSSVGTYSYTKQSKGFNFKLTLGGYSNPDYSYLSNSEFSWFSVGWSTGGGTSGNPYTENGIITQNEHDSFYKIVQKFQTTLGRQI